MPLHLSFPREWYCELPFIALVRSSSYSKLASHFAFGRKRLRALQRINWYDCHISCQVLLISLRKSLINLLSHGIIIWPFMIISDIIAKLYFQVSSSILFQKTLSNSSDILLRKGKILEELLNRISNKLNYIWHQRVELGPRDRGYKKSGINF